MGLTAILTLVLFIAAIPLAAIIGYERGVEAGTKDTERRWSDAVTRADAARARGMQ